MSALFLRTLRDDPADAEVASHKLLVRGGYVRRIAPGVYAWLPLGLRVLRNIDRVVREEMNRIGAQEISLPALLPREPYEATGRWSEYGDALFRLQDRKGNDMLLGPTHEEIFAQIVKGEFSSYKDLPVILYQIQTKYRDEERPRAGILRGREFIMKDSYSFDLTDEGLSEAYLKHRAAYQAIFDRLGVKYVIVAATSGAMGGSASEEFLAEAEAGEDTFVRCVESGYAANVEAVVTAVPAPVAIEGQPAAQRVSTPGAATIDALVSWARENGRPEATAADTLKTIVVELTAPGGEPELVGVLVPGDREIDAKRMEASFEPAVAELLTAERFGKYPFVVKGYVGPQALAANGVRVLADPRVAEGSRWIIGGDEADTHIVDAVVGRDFTPDGTIEAAEVREGDLSPDGAGPLVAARGIEIGHIFQLGRKYTDAFDVDVLSENGKPVRLTMGSYGVGVSRLVAVLAEQSNDEKGLIWPAGVAPFDVHIVVAGRTAELLAAGEEVAAQLSEKGLEVLLDDRKVSPGVKFTDAELLGNPAIVVIGRGWANGVAELRDRATGDSVEVPAAELVDRVVAAGR